MTILENVISVLQDYPDLGSIDICVDYTSDENQNYTVAPTGTVITSRVRDITGDDIVKCQYNCVIFVRRHFLGGLGALENHTFVEQLQFWLMEQNYTGILPQIGDDKDVEYWSSANGAMVEMNTDASTALYSIQIIVEFEKHYSGGN